MKIKETIERNCCEHRDLKPYRGLMSPMLEKYVKDLYFCVHCGKVWRHTTQMDAAGGTESTRVDDIRLEFIDPR